MKVEKARVGCPAGERRVRIVIELRADEEATQTRERAAVSAREDVQAAEASQ